MNHSGTVSGDSARITLEISADGIATAKVTNPGDFRAYGTDHGRINKVGLFLFTLCKFCEKAIQF